jgi:endoglucanase
MLQKIILSFLCLVILSGCAMNPPTPTQSPTPSSSSTLITQSPAPQPISSAKGLDAFEQNKRLGRGVNLGNALEAPMEGEWGVALKEEYFSLIKSAGFDSVRIPIRWSAHASQTPPYTIDTAFFKRIDWAIDQALENNLQLVIDMEQY